MKGANGEYTGPKAVIFDLDGTLVLSTVNFGKFRSKLMEYMERRGADIACYNWESTVVSMISEFEREMARAGHSKEEIETYLDEIEALLNEIELENIDNTLPVPGAEQLLRRLRGRGIRIGVLTRGCPEYAERVLRIAGLDEFVDALLARDRRSGLAPKPSPESALHLLGILGVERDASIMVGDFSIDYECAMAAGIKFVGISSNERSRLSLVECGCREIFDSLNDLDKIFGI